MTHQATGIVGTNGNGGRHHTVVDGVTLAIGVAASPAYQTASILAVGSDSTSYRQVLDGSVLDIVERSYAAFVDAIARCCADDSGSQGMVVTIEGSLERSVNQQIAAVLAQTDHCRDVVDVCGELHKLALVVVAAIDDFGKLVPVGGAGNDVRLSLCTCATQLRSHTEVVGQCAAVAVGGFTGHRHGVVASSLYGTG